MSEEDFSDLPLPDLSDAPEEPASEEPASEEPGVDASISPFEIEPDGDTVEVAPAKVVPVERVEPAPPETEPESKWPRLTVYFSPQVLMFAAVAVTVVVGWLIIRTPTRAGLEFHEIGADEAGPTLILLHGYGAPGTDLTPFSERMVERHPGLRVLCVVAPYGVGFGNAWYLSDGQRVRSRGQLVRFVRELEDEGTARDQIVIAGFSQGAAMATDVSVQLPGLAGVAILSGDHSTPEPLEGRLFVAHGEADSVLSFAVAERRVPVYEETAEVTFVPFPGAHEMRPIEEDFTRWVAETLGI